MDNNVQYDNGEAEAADGDDYDADSKPGFATTSTSGAAGAGFAAFLAMMGISWFGS
jgi:hypothetical protein